MHPELHRYALRGIWWQNASRCLHRGQVDFAGKVIANVLSTQSIAPAFFDIAATAAISVIFINGLVGVSIQISFVYW